tara:strand:+ start:204 stop:578 length:375 start_codon:yes stop_codon:yes gene_type:complete
MKNLNELTDTQLERKLNKAYNSSSYELVDLIEDEQRLRYSDWEKQMAFKTLELKSVTSINLAKYEINSILKLRSELPKGSTKDKLTYLMNNYRSMGANEYAAVLNMNNKYIQKLFHKLYKAKNN